MASSPYTGCELLYLSSFSLRLAPVQCVTRLIVCVPLSCYKVKLASTMHSCFLFWQLECGYKHVVSLSMFCVTSSKQVPDSVYKSVVTLLKHRYVQEKLAEKKIVLRQTVVLVVSRESYLHVHLT